MTRKIVNPPQLAKPVGFAHGVKAGPFLLGGPPWMLTTTLF